MDGTEEHYAKYSKPGGDRQISDDLTFNRNLMKKTNAQNRSSGVETRNRVTGARGDGDRDKGRRRGRASLKNKYK